ncbi:SDR family oxidoreductase [Achromobacter sp. Marseille-Q0513]|uniref:SDR family oxidoreductase n=1 Tax=Achromobacter sp. Marseille-Q0513 TaxID=2829161 RepID=UPI001B8EB2B2|nr:SDR family oxidoreductase [Achromobacter sp. Marseille-Q0513]MBR8653834.1 SDR family oxidoreductase [Achromobacter sp. Marseille-Q0513]
MKTVYRALVTGSSRGIGLAVAKNLLERGISVFGIARTTPVDLIKHAKYEHFNIDLADLPRLERALKTPQIIEKYRDIDVAFLNAGVFGPSPRTANRIDLQDFLSVLHTNTVSNKLLLDSIIEHASPSRILVSSSISGMRQRQGMAAYAVSKAALIALIKTYALENKNIFFANLGLCNVRTQLAEIILQPSEGLTELLLLKERATQKDYLASPADRADQMISIMMGAHRDRIASGDFIEIRQLFNPRGISQS